MHPTSYKHRWSDRLPKEWKAFVGLVQLKIHESDEEVPLLPPKDVIVRRPLIALLVIYSPAASDLPRRTILIRQDAVQKVLFALDEPRRTQGRLGCLPPVHLPE